MYEDIEVLRRLLNGKLQSEYPPARHLAHGWGWSNCAACHANVHAGAASTESWVWGHPYVSPADATTPLTNDPNQPWVLDPGGKDGITYWVQNGQLKTSNNRWGLANYVQWAPGSAQAHPLDTQGVYLKGQGVVYTLTLPPPEPRPKTDTKPAARPASDWDRVRREVRNEKPEADKKEAPRKETTLADLLLQVLAENGHHFSQLGDNESLTVVVTFPTELPAAAKAPASRATEALFSNHKAASAATSDNPGQDYELLGDLHLKQGRAAEAEQAYQQALAQSKSASRTAALRAKMAQALLSGGRAEEAARLLNQLLADKKKEPGTSPQAAQPAAAGGPALPAKLIVSASKRLLDQAAGGKMSLEDFQKAATVEYLNFTPQP
jgi:tetratricopeptide (TPR) repeat protein